MKRRLALTLTIWVFLIGYFFRTLRGSAFTGSQLRSGYGANVDMTRQLIVENGRPESNGEGLTLLSQWGTAQFYDIGSRLLAMVNIVTGTESADSGLALIQQAPLIGALIIPLLLVAGARRAGITNPVASVGIFAFAVLPTYQGFGSVAHGYHTANMAIAYIVLFLVTLIIVRDHRKQLIILLISVSAASMAYHTHAMVFLVIMGVFFLGNRFLPGQYWSRSINSELLFSALLLYTAIGVYINNRISELLGKGIGLLLPSDPGYETVFSSQLQSAATNVFHPRVISTVLALAAAFFLMSWYVFNRFKTGMEDTWESVVQTPVDRVVILGIFSGPFVILAFYLWNGLGPAVQRSGAALMWFVVLATGALIVRASSRRRWIIGMAIFVVFASTSVAIVTQPSYGESSVTVHEAESVKFAEGNIPQSNPVFSDGRLGMTMLYADQRAILAIHMGYDRDYDERLEEVYYSGTARQGLEAIDQVKERQSISQTSDATYLIFSEEMERRGVSLFVAYAKPPEDEFPAKYSESPLTQKVYENGDVYIFREANYRN
ncbi:hypothetical protein OB920_16945 [Halobacteria archaeon HArc-gm2]|nr:hypothetical protein [Halobacteria archaeon HArc-gm2]